MSALLHVPFVKLHHEHDSRHPWGKCTVSPKTNWGRTWENHRQKKHRSIVTCPWSMAPSGAFFSRVFSSSVLSMAPVMAPPGRSSVNCSAAWKTTQGSLVALLQWSGGMFQSWGSQSWKIVWDVDFPMKPGVMIYHDISDMSITNLKSMYVPTATQTALCTKRIR